MLIYGIMIWRQPTNVLLRLVPQHLKRRSPQVHPGAAHADDLCYFQKRGQSVRSLL